MNPVARFLLRPRFENLLRIDAESKPKVYVQIFDGADLQNLNYWLELFLSAGIATLGLVLSSPAVVIGAMLVSPLMGPIIAAGLALATADLYLGIKSALQLAASIAGSILFAAALVWILPLRAPTAEILARTNPNLLDLGVALLSGLAGSLLVSRSQSPSGGGLSALPGVAIAVALMPPLCTVGFGVGAGFDMPIMYGASLLFLTNLAAIVASAFLVFALLRMDSPEVRLAVAQPLLERASHDRIYHFLESRTALSRSFAEIGKLRWRILMLVAAIGVVLFPLSDSLRRLAQELVARDALQRAVEIVTDGRRDTVISERANPYGETITLQLVVTDPVDQQRVEEAEDFVQRRTQRPARLSVRRVADEQELAQLREGLLAAQPQAPTVQGLATIRADLLARLRRPLNSLWPEELACLLDYEIGFGQHGLKVRLRYVSEKPLEEAAAAILQRGLRNALDADIDLVLHHEEGIP